MSNWRFFSSGVHKRHQSQVVQRNARLTLKTSFPRRREPSHVNSGGILECFPEKCEAVFRKEARQNTELGSFRVSIKVGKTPVADVWLAAIVLGGMRHLERHRLTRQSAPRAHKHGPRDLGIVRRQTIPSRHIGERLATRSLAPIACLQRHRNRLRRRCGL